MNLDAKLRFHMSAELIILNNRLKTSIVYVTHDHRETMESGMFLCDDRLLFDMIGNRCRMDSL